MRADTMLDVRWGGVPRFGGCLCQGLRASARLRRPRLAVWETALASRFSIAVLGSQSSDDLSVRHKVGNYYP